MSEQIAGLQVLSFPTSADWCAWLAEHHGQIEAIWVKLAKKSTGLPSITYEEGREGALRYGWIDGQSKSLGATHYLQKFSPRRARSKWSQINCGIVEELMAKGLMFPAGIAQVEAAKADGRWEAAYAPPSKIELPEDFRVMLDQNPAAAQAYGGLKQMERYRICYRLQDAKRPETRERRKAEFLAELLAKGTP